MSFAQHQSFVCTFQQGALVRAVIPSYRCNIVSRCVFDCPGSQSRLTSIIVSSRASGSCLWYTSLDVLSLVVHLLPQACRHRLSPFLDLQGHTKGNLRGDVSPRLLPAAYRCEHPALNMHVQRCTWANALVIRDGVRSVSARGALNRPLLHGRTGPLAIHSPRQVAETCVMMYRACSPFFSLTVQNAVRVCRVVKKVAARVKSGMCLVSARPHLCEYAFAVNRL